MAVGVAYEEDEDPSALLKALGGLKVEYFHEAIRTGEAERRTSTPDDPNNAGGSLDYFLRVRALRQVLRKEEGWKRFNFSNLPLVVNPEKTIALGVLLGDAQTGVPGLRQPRSRKAVGEIKRLLVEMNQQGALFDIPAEHEAFLSEEEVANLDTRFLVTYRRQKSGLVTVHSEVSKAIELDHQGFVIKWKPRICLPPLEFEPVIDYIEGTDDGPSEYEVHVDEH